MSQEKPKFITVGDIRNSNLYWDLITRDFRKVCEEMEPIMPCKGKGTKKGKPKPKGLKIN